MCSQVLDHGFHVVAAAGVAMAHYDDGQGHTGIGQRCFDVARPFAEEEFIDRVVDLFPGHAFANGIRRHVEKRRFGHH